MLASLATAAARLRLAAPDGVASALGRMRPRDAASTVAALAQLAAQEQLRGASSLRKKIKI